MRGESSGQTSPIAIADPAEGTWRDLARDAVIRLQNLASDPIAAADARVMIPIAQIDPTHVRYWAVNGVRTTLAGYSHITGNDVSAPKLENLARVPLPTEQFLEVTSTATPLSREEFRALGDRSGSADAIKAALEAR